MAFPWPTEKPQVQLRTEVARQAVEQANRAAGLDRLPKFLPRAPESPGNSSQSPTAEGNSANVSMSPWSPQPGWSPRKGQKPRLSPSGYQAIQKHKLETDLGRKLPAEDSDFKLRPSKWCAVGPPDIVAEGRKHHSDPSGAYQSSPDRLPWDPTETPEERRTAEDQFRVGKYLNAATSVRKKVVRIDPDGAGPSPQTQGPAAKADDEAAGKMSPLAIDIGEASAGAPTPVAKIMPRKAWVPR